MSDDIYFYEPAHGHGLPHDPFNAIVGPRPIGWISSQDSEGHLNLAPYSFFNAFNYTPPIIGFASIGAKDSLRNIRQTGEFGWSLTTRPLAEAMNLSCATVACEVDEFQLANPPPHLPGASRYPACCKARCPSNAASRRSCSCRAPMVYKCRLGWCSARWSVYTSPRTC